MRRSSNVVAYGTVSTLSGTASVAACWLREADIEIERTEANLSGENCVCRNDDVARSIMILLLIDVEHIDLAEAVQVRRNAPSMMNGNWWKMKVK